MLDVAMNQSLQLGMPLAIDPNDFLTTITPHLTRHDAAAVAQCVQARWEPRQVRRLLRDGDPHVRGSAAMVLGLIGSMADAAALTEALKDGNECVHEMAEHALWSVWFRAGKAEACEPFRAGLSLMAASDYVGAVKAFEKAHEADPAFAEAYNQCAIAHYFAGDWDASLEDCRRTVARVPDHFGAILGMGHCFAHMGEMDLALSAYARALAVNPRMPAIEDAVKRLSERLGRKARPVVR